jgi:O-methyltransferase involved in polyketide biosynthesis
MNHVNKTLYIPLYGKAYVSKKGIILHDSMAESIWDKEGFHLGGKSKSKWLAYFMAMRAAVYDEWVKKEITNREDVVVLHVGCGMDNRIQRVGEKNIQKNIQWYDIDFPDVIRARHKYYSETDFYHMLPTDMRTDEWKSRIDGNKGAVIILEGVSMYFAPEELATLLSDIRRHFKSVKLLMDCYTARAVRASKYKNPIHDVGATVVYGYHSPHELAAKTGYTFTKEHCMTPQNYIDELQGIEQFLFRFFFAGRFAKSMYRMYEFQKES